MQKPDICLIAPISAVGSVVEGRSAIPLQTLLNADYCGGAG